jgi:excisionase family DNA binding protein
MAIASSNLIDLNAAVKHRPDGLGLGLSTLRRHITSGRLPAVKIKGRVYVNPEDLDAFLAPQPMVVADATLTEWAERMAAKAPAFRPEQRDIIMAAFASTLRGA